MEKITVHLADWQVLLREGIHFILSGEEDMEVIGEAISNEEALDFMEGNPPRVAVLNTEPRGVETTRRIKQNLPSVSVILFTDSEDEEELFSAMESGANAYLVKGIDPAELVSIIRKVAGGAYPISEALLRPGIASQVIAEFEALSLIGKGAGDFLAHLSSNEAELLRNVVDGEPIDLAATKKHLDLILTKLVANGHNRELIEAVRGFPIAPQRGEYLTRGEFNAFKESLKKYLKSLSDELERR